MELLTNYLSQIYIPASLAFLLQAFHFRLVLLGAAGEPAAGKPTGTPAPASLRSEWLGTLSWAPPSCSKWF